MEVYGPPSVLDLLKNARGDRSLRSENDDPPSNHTRVLASAVDYIALAATEQAEVAACNRQTAVYINTVAVEGAPFTASGFHDCWRTCTQVFEFLDRLTTKAPKFITKISSIGKTFLGRDIPVYKSSKSSASGNKMALYGQSLIHAREWQAGGSVFFLIAGLLDGLRGGDPRVHAVFDKYDWYFAPIANIDGYDFTWADSSNRLWRKNRRAFSVQGQDFYGVDLNRNYGPHQFFDLARDSQTPGSEVYPGTGVLSEPESAAVFQFLRSLPQKLAGALDVHMNSQTIIRPFSNQANEAPEPYMSKLITLGDNMRQAIQKDSGLAYGNVMGGTGHYLAYGTFKDSIFLEFGYAPAYTLELERMDGTFITSQKTIRDVGKRTLSAFLAFSEGVVVNWNNYGSVFFKISRFKQTKRLNQLFSALSHFFRLCPH